MWTSLEISYVVEAYFSSGRSNVTAQKKFRQSFKRLETPSRKVFQRAVQNFREISNANKKRSPGRPRISRRAVSIERVANATDQSPKKSTRRLAQQVHNPGCNVLRILRKDLNLYPCKLQIVQKLRQQDKIHRITFCDWLFNRIDEFVRHLITSDEAHFHLSRYLIKQNCRFFG